MHLALLEAAEAQQEIEEAIVREAIVAPLPCGRRSCTCELVPDSYRLLLVSSRHCAHYSALAARLAPYRDICIYHRLCLRVYDHEHLDHCWFCIRLSEMGQGGHFHEQVDRVHMDLWICNCCHGFLHHVVCTLVRVCCDQRHRLSLCVCRLLVLPDDSHWHVGVCGLANGKDLLRTRLNTASGYCRFLYFWLSP